MSLQWLQDYIASSGDFLGFLTMIYTDSMGNTFLGLFFVALTIPMYNYNRSLTVPAIIWLIVFGALEIFIPGDYLNFGKIILVIALAILGFKVIFRR